MGDIQDAINPAYSNYSIEDTALLFVPIKERINIMNKSEPKLDKESELSTGDFLMVVKNNYFWLKDSDEAGFIANGDIIEILEIFNIKVVWF
jgi:hypothetical protein